MCLPLQNVSDRKFQIQSKEERWQGNKERSTILPARCASTQLMGYKGSIHSALVTALLAMGGSCHYLEIKACS